MHQFKHMLVSAQKKTAVLADLPLKLILAERGYLAFKTILLWRTGLRGRKCCGEYVDALLANGVLLHMQHLQRALLEV